MGFLFIVLLRGAGIKNRSETTEGVPSGVSGMKIAGLRGEKED